MQERPSMDLSPLPRSLDPLPEESLAGYLLRLSFRLSLAPRSLLYRTGLVTQTPGSGYIPHQNRMALALDQDTAATFGRVTRLTNEEVTALTLASWRHHYRPIDACLPPGQLSRVDAWLSLTSGRYCPLCLAGDGSPIQNQLGGSWKKTWLLPVVFACLDHGVFLRDRCPRCQGSPHSRPEFPQLLLRGGDNRLHPTQCRNWEPTPNYPAAPGGKRPACAARLDSCANDHPAINASTEMLTFQRRILDLLDPQHPADHATRYFADLRLITALICESWPAARNRVPPDLALVTERHVFGVDENGRSVSERMYFTRIPTDALACGALLYAADAIRNTPDLRRALLPLVTITRGPNPRSRWTELFVRRENECSTEFHRAAGPLARAYRKQSTVTGADGRTEIGSGGR
jgi:hypothetical protein